MIVIKKPTWLEKAKKRRGKRREILPFWDERFSSFSRLQIFASDYVLAEYSTNSNERALLKEYSGLRMASRGREFCSHYRVS